MAEIIGIKKRSGACTVTFSDARTLRLPGAMTEHFHLRRGEDADPDMICARLEKEAMPYALAEIIKMQARRDHTKREILQALRGKAYPDTAANAAVAQMESAGVVDEARFGEGLVNRKKSQKGRNALRMEMRSKGLDAAAAENALADFDEETETSAAYLRAKKMAQRGLTEEKIFAALFRRGYGRSMIMKVLSQLRSESDL